MVKEVMTQINYVFTVCEDSIIDYDFMQKITDAGHSRIPVRKKEPNGTGDIIGIYKKYQNLTYFYLIFKAYYFYEIWLWSIQMIELRFRPLRIITNIS